MNHDIKYLDKHISDELEGAECYCDKAMQCKSNNNIEHAQVYINMATQELGHAELLMNMLDEHIKKWDSEHPDSRDNNVYREIWKDYHKDKVDKFGNIKDKISKFR